MSAALVNPTLDHRRDYEIADLRLASVTQAGKILRWHVVARNDITVGELLNVIVTRSQATHSPLQFNQVVLVELVNNRLHRTFSSKCRLDKIRRDDYLVVYEVPMLDGEALSGDVRTVACHARLVHNPAESFFGEAGEMHRDLVGLPLMFKVPADVSERRLYELVAVGMYGASYEAHSATFKDELPFGLYSCEHVRALTTGGSPLDPVSDDRARLSVPFADRAAALLVAEWPASAPLAPWILHQTGGPHTDVPDSFVEAYIGVDAVDLLQQVRLLQESRLELQEEVVDLRKAVGRYSAAMAAYDNRSFEPNNGKAIRPEATPSPISNLGTQLSPSLKGKLGGGLAVSGAAESPSQQLGTTIGMPQAASRREIRYGLGLLGKCPPTSARASSTGSRRRSPVFSTTSQDDDPPYPEDMRASLMVSRLTDCQ